MKMLIKDWKYVALFKYFICDIYILISKTQFKDSKSFHHDKFEKNGDYYWFQLMAWAIFVVWLLINWLVNVADILTDILTHYVLQMTPAKFAKCML